jgi:hypothetical protein
MAVQAVVAAALALSSTPPIWAAAAVIFTVGAAEGFIRPAFNALLRGVLVLSPTTSGYLVDR